MLASKKIAIFIICFVLLSNTSYAFQQDYTPTDPSIVYQTYFKLIDIEPSWSNDLVVNKEPIVAVLDSGIDLDHPDLINNLWVNSGEIPGDGLDNDNNSYIDDVHGWNFVESNNNLEPKLEGDFDYTAVNHGTVVAGIIAAEANGNGIVGIAPQAKIMSLKILNEKGSGNVAVLAQAINYAVENGADVINLSLVGNAYDDNLKKAIDNAYNQGVMIVAASGNESSLGISLDVDPRYPVCDIGSSNRVLGVAAVDENLVMTKFSNYGEKCIDITAPGANFYSTIFNSPTAVSTGLFDSYYSGGWSGTSVAAPVISATAALIRMQYPESRPYDVYAIIKASAQDLQKTNPFHHVDLGAGLIDIGLALNLAEVYYNEGVKLVVAPEAGLAPEILIMDNEGNLRSTFLAYSSSFKGGVNVATGDVNNDGHDEIITAPMAGGGPHIRVFDQAGKLLSEFFAYEARFNGGVNIAVGDVNNDGLEEIITAPLSKGGPHVKVFKSDGTLISEFFAYEAQFYGGVNLATGDVNNDGLEEIITAPVTNHSPEIKVYDYLRSPKGSFLAYGVDMTQGVEISVGDVNNDKWPEIITIPAKNVAPELKMFSGRGTLKGEFLPYSKYLRTGAKVLARDISGDGLLEILTLPNRGDASLLKVYDTEGLQKDSFYLRNPLDRNGYNLDVLNR